MQLIRSLKSVTHVPEHLSPMSPVRTRRRWRESLHSTGGSSASFTGPQ